MYHLALSGSDHLATLLCSEGSSSCAMAADQILSSSYFKYSDERQLIDDDEEEDIWLEDLDYDNESAEISPKHVHFVTDATLSSWKDQDAAAYHSSTSLG